MTRWSRCDDEANPTREMCRVTRRPSELVRYTFPYRPTLPHCCPQPARPAWRSTALRRGAVVDRGVPSGWRARAACGRFAARRRCCAAWRGWRWRRSACLVLARACRLLRSWRTGWTRVAPRGTLPPPRGAIRHARTTQLQRRLFHAGGKRQTWVNTARRRRTASQSQTSARWRTWCDAAGLRRRGTRWRS